MASSSQSKKSGFPWKFLIFAGVIGAAAYWGPGMLGHTGGSAHAGGAAGGAMPVSVSNAVGKSITVWSEFSGKVEAVRAAEIRPRVGGQIMRVYFKDGEEVVAGEPLFLIDQRPYIAEVTRARGAFAAAKSAQNLADRDYARAKKLIGVKAVSTAEYEQRAAALNQANGNAETAKGALAAAEVNLDYTMIRAPISGKISRAEITEGNLVDAGGNAPLLASIVTLSPVYASFELDEQTFLATIQGLPASKLKKIPVEVGLSNEANTPHKATIHAFDNQLAAGSGTIRVRAVVPNKDERLLPGLFARVRLGTPEPQEVVLINPGAIGTDQNKKFVFVVGDGNKAEYREVTLGGMSDGLQIIMSGLKDGEPIVVNGLQRLRPGAPMTPTTVDMLTLKGPDVADASAPHAAH